MIMARMTRTGLAVSMARKTGTAMMAEAMPPQRMTLLAPNFSPMRPAQIRTKISKTAARSEPSSRVS